MATEFDTAKSDGKKAGNSTKSKERHDQGSGNWIAGTESKSLGGDGKTARQEESEGSHYQRAKASGKIGFIRKSSGEGFG